MLCLIAAPMTSQASPGNEASVDPIDKTEGYLAQLYDNTSGLPTSEANDIAETSEGFIWIGSYSGLIRYDGDTFERYDSTTGITSVRCLCVDSRDRLWIGTNDNGVAMMAGGELTHWGEDEGLQASSVRSIVEDKDGNIYVGTTAGITLITPDLHAGPIVDEKIGDAYVKELRIDESGLIYCVTNPGDLFTIRDGVLEDYCSAEEDEIGGVDAVFPYPANSGAIYVASKDGVVYRAELTDDSLKIGESIDISPLTQVQRFEYIDGRVWLCTRDGIGVLDDTGLHCLRDLPMNNSVGHVMTDYEGNLWFTSSRQGVMKIVPSIFSDIFERYDIPDQVINSTCMYQGRLYVAGDKGLTVIGPEGVRKRIPLESAVTVSGEDLKCDDLIRMLDGCRIRSVIRDSKDRLWISTWREWGLLRFDGKSVTAFTMEDGLYSDTVRHIYECSDGRILVACTGGVNVIEDDQVVAGYSREEGIENTDILNVTEGKAGDILCGTDGGGIYIINDDTIRHIGRNEGLTSEAVMRIKHDIDRDIWWVITGNSISYLDSEYELHNIDTFPYSNNFDLYENGQGQVWILSSNGIHVLQVDDLIGNENLQPVHIGMANGMPCIATANSYSELTDEGDLYIAGATGVAKVNIADALGSGEDVKADVPYIDADGVRIYPDENGDFLIASDVQKLTIYGYVYNYSLTDPVVSYRLDGFDKKSVTTSRSEFDPVDYTNLPGGTYDFIMYIRDPMSRNEQTVSVRLIKQKAVYEYIAFYIMAAVVLLFFIFLCVGLYVADKVEKIEKKNREEAEKERIRNELDTAYSIQSGMLPSEFPAFPGINEIDLYATMEPAKEVGGDFYDFFLTDSDHAAFVIADVSGKGVPAALFMMKSQTIIKSVAMLGLGPAEVLEKTNEALCLNNKVDMFVTVWLAVLEISTGKLVMANAGHEYPAIRRRGGCFELIKDKHGLILGGLEGIKFNETEIILEPGDSIFVYTDGVPEATNDKDELFGTERMTAALNEEPDASPDRIIANVRSAVGAFEGETEQFDDLTMLCIEYKGQEVAQ